MTESTTVPRKADRFDIVEAVFMIIGAALLVVCVVGWFIADRTRPAVSFDAASTIQITDAKPGGWVHFEVPVIKHRDCVLQPDSRGPIIFYADGTTGAPDLWLRDGPLLSPKEDTWQRGAVKFHLPKDAPVGPASMVFEASFQCWLARVTHQTPTAEFTVLE